jgi:flagellar biosynthesis component FlhA
VNIAQAIHRTETGTILDLEPDTGRAILASIGEEVGRMSERCGGLQPIILCAPQIRPALKRMTGRSFPNLVVMSWNEIAENVDINSVGLVSIDIPSIDVLAMDVKLERWLSSHVMEINRKLEIKLDEVDEEILIRAIDKQIGKLESSKDSKIILCSANTHSVITWSLWGRLLRETLKERFPGISFTVKDKYAWYSSRYNIVGIVSLDDDQPSEGVD